MRKLLSFVVFIFLFSCNSGETKKVETDDTVGKSETVKTEKESVEKQINEKEVKRYRNLNELEEFKDFDIGGGALIGENLDYSISSLLHKEIKTTRLIALEKVYSGSPSAFSLIDTLIVENIPENHYFGYQLCRLNGEMDSEIIVLYESEENVEYYTKIKRAWRADTKLQKIVEIDTSGIDYCNEGYGV